MKFDYSCLGLKFKSRILGKKLYFIYLYIFARPKFQKLNEFCFRILIGSMGYMNSPENFKLTGERKLIQKLEKFNLRVIIDIGANKGQWSSMVLEETEAHIYAFEPQQFPYVKLMQLSMVSDGRLSPINLALGENSRRISINVHKTSDELSFIGKELQNMPLLEKSVKKQEMIKISTLDLFVEEYFIDNIDFIKIDTEGYEYEVITGADKAIKSLKPRFIQIEMNWHQLFKGHSLYEISQLLPKYELYQILPFGKVLYKIDSRQPLRNFYQLSNFLFVRAGTTFG